MFPSACYASNAVVDPPRRYCSCEIVLSTADRFRVLDEVGHLLAMCKTVYEVSRVGHAFTGDQRA
jgi:hypothetical protein